MIKEQKVGPESSNNLIVQNETSSKSSQEAPPPETVGFFQLFRFADQRDKTLMAAGTFFAVCNGAAMPLFALLWGNMLDSFKNPDDMTSQTLNMLLIFIYIGLTVFVTGWGMIACWTITGERQSIACRRLYLKSLLRQEIGWFDLINQAELSSQFSADTMAFQAAIGDKVPLVMYVVAMAISGMVVAFVKGWLLTLVLLGVFPLIIGSMYLYMYNIRTKAKREDKSYAQAGGRAEQALYSIKTVKMLNGQQYESENYDKELEEANSGKVKFGIFSGISTGGAFFAMLSAYALGFWYGAHCISQTDRCLPSIARQEYTAGTVFTVFFSIIIVGFNMSQLPTSLKSITEGRASAARIYHITDRQPKIKNPQNGVRIADFKGIIKFHNVSFSYPKEPNRKILNNISLEINKHKVAFVGESGCGKSTIFQLIMRFYDPDEGFITIDGHDLKTIDLTWLREVIGYVGQEPVLFATSIKQNLLYAKEDATDEELEAALKKAEAYDFVQQLENKMDTYVGLGGGQISGGQKQRLAIARAILKNPKILLLDEATSALDRKNQKLIQNTLNEISKDRTSMTIAHRVKTIMKSDDIFVIEFGKVKEQGKFEDLERFKGMEIDKEEQVNQGQIKRKQQAEEPLDVQEQKLTKQEQETKEKEQLLEVYNKNTFGRVFSYARGNQILFIIGILASGVLGAIYPVFSIFLASMLKIMLVSKNFIDDASTKALIFFLLGVLAIVVSVIQNVCFEVIGGKITQKIRSEVFYKMMKLPIYWYERPKNNVGSLTTRLAVDCKQVKEMTTTYVYGLLQNISSLVTGLVIAFIFEWRTALVALGLIPFMIAAGAIRMAFKIGSASKSQQTYRESSGIIMESMNNIRTVCSFGYENIIYNKYSRMLEQPERQAVKSGVISGFFYGISQLILFIVIALIFYLGSLFVQYNGVNIDNMFTSIFSIFFSAMTVGNNSHILPDLGNCKVSAANLFLILDTKDQDQIQIDEKSRLLKHPINGDFVFRDIKFKYESRTEYLFNNFNLTLPFGEKLAFVGTSGCGKSTIMSFLLRFYVPESGEIYLDNINIKDYDVHFLRSQFGVVSQEPTLFNASFRENIIYNMKTTDEEMIEAAKKGLAYEFIMANYSQPSVNSKKVKPNQNGEPQPPASVGFDRSVGIRGSHISGGQKQRVAIARAILRKPEILLLDEATSALDRENEMKVQQAIDQIMVNKTSISIAHRLETIRNSKTIYVFDKGRVAESGSYDELMRKKGYFYNLQKGIEFK